MVWLHVQTRGKFAQKKNPLGVLNYDLEIPLGYIMVDFHI